MRCPYPYPSVPAGPENKDVSDHTNPVAAIVTEMFELKTRTSNISNLKNQIQDLVFQ